MLHTLFYSSQNKNKAKSKKVSQRTQNSRKYTIIEFFFFFSLVVLRQTVYYTIVHINLLYMFWASGTFHDVIETPIIDFF